MAIYRGPGGPGDATTDATSEGIVASNAAAAALASQTAAAASATAAAASASAASTSASAASSSASSASSSASTATTQASNASSSASAALTSENNAETAETNATASASLANDWATKTSGPVAGGEYSAKYHASAASTSASNASTSASNAATSASNASTSASNASTSATNAAASAASAAASFDSFDDIYLGPKASAPTVDNDGNALQTGAIYWNTTTNSLWIRDGSAWNPAAFSASGSVISFNSRTGAVTLTSSDVTTALGFTPGTGNGNGTVTSVAATVPTGLTVSGSPVTTSGTLAISYDTGYAIPTTAKQTQWDTAYGWGNHASAGYLTSATAATTYQPLDGDLTAIAALSGTSGLLKKTAANTYTLDTNTYLTSYTETDPIYTASSWYSTTNNASNWNTAYGWGNHASAGYLTSAAIGSTVQGYDANTAKYNVANTWTAKQTFPGATTTIAAKFTNALELTTVSATAATGTINYDVTTQSVLYYTTNASANWTVNFRGNGSNSLDSLMSAGEAITVVFLVSQGATAYYNSAVQIDGSSVTPKYQGGIAWSSGNASGIDAYSYTIVKTGSAAFTVFAAQTQFK